MHVYVHIIITPHGVIITPPLDLGGDGHGLSEQFRGGWPFWTQDDWARGG